MGATLCSRFTAAPQLVLTNARSLEDPELVIAVQLPDMGTPFYIFGGINVTGRGNFPYGFDVEADVDM